MREILFRGKTEEGKWVYGTPVKVTYNTYPTNFIEMVEYHEYDELDDYCLMSYDDRVLPETVGQFTGLTDKNGTKIFEGDIVKYVFPVENAEPDIGEVKFSECYRNSANYNCGFFIEWEDSYLRKDIGYWTNYKENKIEVIGNIHDNPGLTK